MCLLNSQKTGSNYGSLSDDILLKKKFSMAPRPARGRAGSGCGRGSPAPAVRVRGYSKQEQTCRSRLNQFQNFNFSAVIAPLVVRTKKPIKCKLWNNTCCEISCFLKTTAKKLGATHCWSPNLKSTVRSGIYVTSFSVLLHLSVNYV